MVPALAGDECGKKTGVESRRSHLRLRPVRQVLDGACNRESNKHIARPHAGADNVHIPVCRDASMFWYGSDNRLWVVLIWVSPV